MLIHSFIKAFIKWITIYGTMGLGVTTATSGTTAVASSILVPILSFLSAAEESITKYINSRNKLL